MPHQPSWYRQGKVVVSRAPKCGINKDGIDKVIVDGTKQIGVDDILYADVLAIRSGKSTSTTSTVSVAEVMESWEGVPIHYDPLPLRRFKKSRDSLWPSWSDKTLGELIDLEWVVRRVGHGSPSKDQRVGKVPYIKVSDLRAGLVNINTTNMVSEAVAHDLWKDTESGLQAFDLLTPDRASSNIGEFCVLMPGQEQVVLTREVLVLRVSPSAPFDAFYLMWALSLQIVRDQWKRIIFMQTNREDVGDRYREIVLPIPPKKSDANSASKEFKDYFMGLSKLRTNFSDYLESDGMHHFTMSGAEASTEEEEIDGLANTAELMSKLLKVPKSEIEC